MGGINKYDLIVGEKKTNVYAIDFRLKRFNGTFHGNSIFAVNLRCFIFGGGREDFSSTFDATRLDIGRVFINARNERVNT